MRDWISHDSTTEVWGRLMVVWLGTLFSRESLSYLAIAITIGYTLTLWVTLIRDKWVRKQ